MAQAFWLVSGRRVAGAVLPRRTHGSGRRQPYRGRREVRESVGNQDASPHSGTSPGFLWLHWSGPTDWVASERPVCPGPLSPSFFGPGRACHPGAGLARRLRQVLQLPRGGSASGWPSSRSPFPGGHLTTLGPGSRFQPNPGVSPNPSPPRPAVGISVKWAESGPTPRGGPAHTRVGHGKSPNGCTQRVLEGAGRNWPVVRTARVFRLGPLCWSVAPSGGNTAQGR